MFTLNRRQLGLALVSATLAAAVWAADGDVDTSFSSDGKVQFNFANTDGDTLSSAAVQSNGEILAAGMFIPVEDNVNPNNRLFIARFNATTGAQVGTLTSVSIDVVPEGSGGVYVAPTGEIIIVSNRCVENESGFQGCTGQFTKYNSAGVKQGATVDVTPSFSSTNGSFCEGAYGGMLFEGSTFAAACTVFFASDRVLKPAVIRRNLSDLSAASGFGTNGIAVGSANGNTAFNPDAGSNNNGGFADGSGIISDGSGGYYLAAESYTSDDSDDFPPVDYDSRFYVQHFSSAGVLDTSFGTNGIAEISRTSFDADGTVTVQDFNGGGTAPAATFRKGHEDGALARDSNGRILIYGRTFCFSNSRQQGCTDQDSFVARLLTNGQFDTSFAGNGKRIDDSLAGFSFRIGGILFDDANRLYLLGNNELDRLLPNGNDDTSFNGVAFRSGSDLLNQPASCSSNPEQSVCGNSSWAGFIPADGGKNVILLGGAQDFSAMSGNTPGLTAIVAKIKLNDPPDTEPDVFTFNDLTDQQRNLPVLSNTITITGLNTTALATITGNGASQRFFVNGNEVFGGSSQVNNNDTVRVGHTTSSLGSTTTRTRLTIGPIGGANSGSRFEEFVTTTVAADNTPESFQDFTAVNNHPTFGTPVTSNTQTITTIEGDNTTPISITGGEYSIGCNGNFSTGGTINNGDTVCVRVTSSNNRSTAVTARLTIGTVTRSFVVTTRAAGVADLSPTSINFGNQPSGLASATRPVALNNLGNAPLVITNIGTTGEFNVASENCPDTLAVDASCVINVRFAPTSQGGKSGSLNVASDGQSSPSSVSLTGTGTEPAPVVSLTPSSVAFGNVPVGNAGATRFVTLRNDGNATLTIASITSSLGDYSTSGTCPIGMPIAADASCQIGIDFSPAARGNRNASIIINSNAPSNPDAIAVSGFGTAAVASVSAATPFGNRRINTGNSAAQTLTISNTGDASLNVTTVALTGAQANQFALTNNTCNGQTLAPNATCAVNVSFAPTSTGAKSATVAVTTANGGNPTTAVSGTGVVPTITLSRASVPFGDQPRGSSSAAQTVRVTNSGSDTLTFTSITKGGTHADDFTLSSTACGSTLAVNASCDLSLRFAPTALGERSAAVTIVSDASNTPNSIALSGNGTESAVAFSPSSLTFTGQRTGTASGVQTVTLQNAGTAPLNNIVITTTGDYAQTSNCPSTLAASSSCTISVRFTPTARGSRTGAVNVASDAPGTPHQVQLTGTGIAPVAAVNPTTLSYEGQRTGTTSAAQTVTVTNTGDAPLVVSAANLSGTNAGDFSRVSGCSTVAANGGTCTVNVSFAPTVAGNRTATLTLETDDGARTVSLSGTGTAPIVVLDPGALTFAGQRTGTTSTAQSVMVRNTGTAPLIVSAANLSGAHAADFNRVNGCGTVAVGTSCTISVTVTPAATGTRSATLTVVTDAGSPTVALTGTGTAPVIAVAPASLTFDPQATATTSAAQVVTVRNTGTAAMSVGTITVTGAQAAEYSQTHNCNTVAAGASCVVNVSFRPVATGTRSATLNIPSDAGITATVSLSGAGLLSDTEAGRDSTGGNAGNVTLTADRGAALTFEPADAPTTGVPANTATPVGFFDFTVTGLSTTGPAETVAFTFTLPAGVSANGYLKCNAGTCALFEGAVVNGNQVTFSITDNGVGDDDPARGTIRDPGAPALTSNNSNLSVSSGGGAMPGLLALFGLAGLLFRRRTFRR